MKKLIFILILTLFIINTAKAEESYTYSSDSSNGLRKHLYFSMNFVHGYGKGKFGRNIDQSLNGFNLELGFFAKDRPLAFGISWTVNSIGRIDINEDDIYTTSNLLRLKGKIIPRHRFIAPYLEASVGLSFFSTTIEYYGDSEDTENLAFDVTYNYGLGAGVLLSLTKNKILFLDVGANYIFGDYAKYVPREQLDYWPTISESRTDMINFNIGITIVL